MKKKFILKVVEPQMLGFSISQTPYKSSIINEENLQILTKYKNKIDLDIDNKKWDNCKKLGSYKAPIEKDEKNKKTAKYRTFSSWISIKILNTKIDKKLIIIDLVIEAKITANVTSSAESGLPTKSTIFPIIFPDSIEDDECAKDC